MHLQFINHASVLFSDNNNTGLLTDPWYEGDVFDKGWKLLFENEEKDILKILNKTKYIWYSHEHPDHFAINFLKKYRQYIFKNNIKFLFQETEDKRVLSFLKSNDFETIELKNNHEFKLNKNFSVTVHKSDFYDSALVMVINNKKIFNINDCPINSNKSIFNFKKKFGNCDILLTQFSYAAWKGGKKNLEWRKRAAKEKQKTLVDQSNLWNAKVTIPFASFIYFCDEFNFYLNDSINHPKDIFDLKKQTNSKILFLKPYQIFEFNDNFNQNEGYIFWEKKFQNIKNFPINKTTEKFDFNILQKNFQKYRIKLFQKNSFFFCKLISKISLLKIFSPLNVKFKDLGITIFIDIINGKFEITNQDADIEMYSRSINLIFLQGFGFDTLTINGCFEEKKENGFVKMTQALALGNLNNLGIFVNWKILFNIRIILIFLSKIFSVRKKLEYKHIDSLG